MPAQEQEIGNKVLISHEICQLCCLQAQSSIWNPELDFRQARYELPKACRQKVQVLKHGSRPLELRVTPQNEPPEGTEQLS